MAILYVRPDASHGGNNSGSSYTNAYQGWASISWAALTAGSTLYVCGTLSGAILTIGAHGGTSSSRVVIRGDAPEQSGSMSFVAGQFLIPRSHTELRNITISGTSRCCLTTTAMANWWCEGVTFNGGTNPIFLIGAGNGINHSDLVFRRNVWNGGGCAATPGSSAAFDWFAAVAATGAAGTSTVTRIRFEENQFNNVNPAGDGRGVIGMRSEEGVNVAAIVTDFLATDNVFRNCRGYAIEAYDGHSFGAASPQYGLWKGARVMRNSVHNQGADATGILGGAFSIFGFDNSATSAFGPNVVTDNYVDGAAGQAGGANICYGTSRVANNVFKNLTTTSIDACGILIDYGAKDCIVVGNVLIGMPGKSGVLNSGAGIMVLDADNTRVYGNVCVNMKCGLFFGNVGSGKKAYVDNNAFVDCVDFGIYIAAGADHAGCFARNNIFTAKAGASPVSVSDGASGWTLANYNNFFGAFAAPVNHTLGANTTTTDPLLADPTKPWLGLKSSSPAWGAGTVIQGARDRFGRRYSIPPNIGPWAVKSR